jgi:hypothetical protein
LSRLNFRAARAALQPNYFEKGGPNMQQHPHTRRTRTRTAVLLAAALAMMIGATACAGVVDSVVGVAGRYQLTQIDGTAIGSGFTIQGTEPVLVV